MKVYGFNFFFSVTFKYYSYKYYNILGIQLNNQIQNNC